MSKDIVVITTTSRLERKLGNAFEAVTATTCYHNNHYETLEAVSELLETKPFLDKHIMRRLKRAVARYNAHRGGWR